MSHEAAPYRLPDEDEADYGEQEQQLGLDGQETERVGSAPFAEAADDFSATRDRGTQQQQQQRDGGAQQDSNDADPEADGGYDSAEWEAAERLINEAEAEATGREGRAASEEGTVPQTDVSGKPTTTTAVTTARSPTAASTNVSEERRPEEDKALMRGEADLAVVSRVAAQFDVVRREVQLPVLDAILLNKYIAEPVVEAAEKSRAYYAKRRQAAEQLCADMPLIAAAVAAQVEPSVEGGGGAPSPSSSSPPPARAGTGAALTAAALTLTTEEFSSELDLTVGPPPAIPLTRRRAVGRLVKLLNLLSDHKRATLAVLEAVARRERALEATMELASANAAGELHDVEAALLIHKALFEVQTASLLVVERIQRWREGLCMPHPFAVAPGGASGGGGGGSGGVGGGGDNYILKMFADCRMLSEHPTIQKMLPMQDLFTDFPLFSNVSSISQYVIDREAVRGPFAPMGAPPLDLALHRRLQQAEAYMHTEIELQLAMVRALLAMVGRSEFLPVVNISPVCPPLMQQQKAAAERLQRAEGRVRPLRVCLPIGASTVGAEPTASATAAVADPHSSVGRAVLKFTRGIRVGSRDMRERHEATLMAYFSVLQSPPRRAAYDEKCKEDHRRATAKTTFKTMRTKSSTVAGARQQYAAPTSPSAEGAGLGYSNSYSHGQSQSLSQKGFAVSPPATPQHAGGRRPSLGQRQSAGARPDENLSSPSATVR